MTGEDAHLEMAYEDRYVSESDWEVDEYGTCDFCGNPIDYCLGHPDCFNEEDDE